jgi:hypothetical protein
MSHAPETPPPSAKPDPANPISHPPQPVGEPPDRTAPRLPNETPGEPEGVHAPSEPGKPHVPQPRS